MNRGVLRRALGTVAIAIIPFVIVAAAWTVAAPRLRVVALGDGTGSPTYGSSGAEVSATFMLSAMIFGAGAASALVLWRRHARLRDLPSALAGWLGIGILGAATASVSVVIAKAVFTTDIHAPEATVLELAPRLATQVMTTAEGTPIAESFAMAAWAVGGALAMWFVASYMALGRDLR